MPIEPAVLFAFGAMFFWGIGDFLAQKTIRRIGNFQSLALIGIMELVFLSPFAIQEESIAFAFANLPLIVFLGISLFVVALVNFEALKHGKLSMVQVIWVVELPVTVLLGIIFFGEQLSAVQFGRIGIVFAGVVLASFSELSGKLSALEKGFFIALIGAFGMGLTNFLTAAASKNISPIMAIWLPALIYTPLCLAFIWKRDGFKKFFANTKKSPKLILSFGIVNILAWVFFALAVKEALLSITISITEAYPIIGIILGVWLNKEKLASHQYLGAVLALAGIIALGFLG